MTDVSSSPRDGATAAERLERVRARMAAACERAGRSLDAVRPVAVSKTKPAEAVCELAACGQTLFGENRVQEAQTKIPRCPPNLEWHLIGHLQTNKAKQAVRLFRMIHSVDSIKLLETLDRCAATPLPVLLQVNVSGEASKFGMRPEDLETAIETANTLQKVEVHGLMTIPPFSPDPEKTRKHFAALRELRDRTSAATATPLPELSMGMSNDFEVAIEEGATFVRVGTDLFGRR